MEEVNAAVKQDPPQSAEKFMRQVRRQNRKKFTAEEKIRIVLEGMKREIPVSELCRREGIPTAAYYSWVKCFMEAALTPRLMDNNSARVDLGNPDFDAAVPTSADVRGVVDDGVFARHTDVLDALGDKAAAYREEGVDFLRPLS